MKLITVSTKTHSFFSTTGKVGGKAVRRLNRRGKPVYTVAKFPAGEKVELSVDKSAYVAKAIAALLYC